MTEWMHFFVALQVLQLAKKWNVANSELEHIHALTTKTKRMWNLLIVVCYHGVLSFSWQSCDDDDDTYRIRIN